MRSLRGAGLMLAVAAVLVLAGCAALDNALHKVEEHERSAELVIKYATIKYIGENPGKAERVVAVVLKLETQVDSGATATIEALEERVRAEIDWSKIDTADRLLVDTLIGVVRDELVKHIGSGGLTEDQKLVVLKVFQWVRQAATLARA